MENGSGGAQSRPRRGHEPVWKDGAGAFDPGRIGQAAAFDGKRYVEVGNVANFGFYDAFTLSAWIYPTAPTGAIVSRAQDEAGGQGWSAST